MATYKDDLDIIKAAEKDSSKLSLNAITELDNKGMLGMYGGGGSEEDLYPDFGGYFTIDLSADPISYGRKKYYKIIAVKEPRDVSVDGIFYRNDNVIGFFEKRIFDSNHKEFSNEAMHSIEWYSELGLEENDLSGVLQPNTWYYGSSGK